MVSIRKVKLIGVIKINMRRISKKRRHEMPKRNHVIRDKILLVSEIRINLINSVLT